MFKSAADTTYVSDPHRALPEREAATENKTEDKTEEDKNGRFVLKREGLTKEEAWWVGGELRELMEEKEGDLGEVCAELKQKLTEQFGSTWHVVGGEKGLGCAVNSNGLTVQLVAKKKKLFVTAWRFTPSFSTLLSKWLPVSSIPTLLTFISLFLLVVHYFLKKKCMSCCPEDPTATHFNEEGEVVCDAACSGRGCDFVLGPMWSLLTAFAIGGMVLKFMVPKAKDKSS